MPHLSLEKALRETLTDKIDENRLIVWYDEGGTLEPILENITPKNTDLVRYEGSYLKIRVQIEQEEDLNKKRIIYIPEKPLKSSWIRDYELLGEKLELDLQKILRDRFQLRTTPQASQILTPPNCKLVTGMWNNVMGEINLPLTMEQVQEAMIASILGQHTRFDLEEAVLTYLENPNRIKQLLEKSGLKEAFIDILERNGLPRIEDLDPDRVAAATLISELVHHLEIDETGFENILPKPDKQRLWVNIAQKWASNTTLKESFLQWSHKIESEYNITDLLRGREGIENVESFQAVDTVLLDEIKARTEEKTIKCILNHAEYIEKISTSRSNKLWTREGKMKEWTALQKSIEIIKRIEKNLTQIDRENILSAYFEEHWMIDQLFRDISPYKRNLDRSIMENIINPITKRYQKWLQETNEALNQQVEKQQKWPPPNIDHQIDFWKTYMKLGQKTCLFLVDALRWELQNRLAERIKKRGHKVNHAPLLSSLPSITEVCMPALLPKQTFDIKSINNELEINVNNEKISSKEDRLKHLKKEFMENIAFLDLKEFREDLQTISRKTGNVSIIVVSDTEIDKAGRFLSDDILEHFDDSLERLETAIETATILGCQRIIITTDHGFLIIPEPESVKTIDGYDEKGLASSRRYAVGKPSKTEGCITLPLRNVGYQSDDMILLPRGISYLPKKGKKEAYIHGGLSLQECCIGVLDVEPQTMGKKVGVKAEISEPISSMIVRVKLIPQTTELFPIPRTVKAELIHKGEALGSTESVELIRQPHEAYMRMGKTKGVESVDLRVVDIATKEIVFRKEVKVTLGGYDDLL